MLPEESDFERVVKATQIGQGLVRLADSTAKCCEGLHSMGNRVPQDRGRRGIRKIPAIFSPVSHPAPRRCEWIRFIDTPLSSSYTRFELSSTNHPTFYRGVKRERRILCVACVGDERGILIALLDVAFSFSFYKRTPPEVLDLSYITAGRYNPAIIEDVVCGMLA